MVELLVFRLDEIRYALPTARVIEVALRVRITPLAGTNPPVVGVIVYRGRPVVTVDLRMRLGHPPRVWQRDDHLLICHGARRSVALMVDRADELMTVTDTELHPPPVPTRDIQGIVPLADGTVLLHDLDALLSLEEEHAVDRALESVRALPAREANEQ